MCYVVQLPALPARAAYCVESWPAPSDRHAYAVFLLLSTYVGPIIAIIVSYALIGHSLCLRNASTFTPTSSITTRRAVVASTVDSREGPGVVGGAGRAMALTGHGGLLQGAGESWPCSPGGGVAAGSLMMMPTIPGPINASRCSREASIPAGSGLQVPGRAGRQLSSSSSTSESERKKAAAAALLVAGYSAAGDGIVALGDNNCATIAVGPSVRRRHPMSTRSMRVPTVGPYRDAINRSRRSVVRLLVTIVVVFVASWLPYNVVSLRVDLSLDAGEARILPFALWLGHAHSAVNPVLYWFFNKTFRHCVRNVLQRCFGICRRSRNHLHASQYV